MPEKFWGDEVRVSRTDETGTVGVVVNGVRIKNSTYTAGKKIVDAGPEGLDTDAVLRTDVDILRSAGVNIGTDAVGLRFRMDGSLPAPSGYLIKVQKPEAATKRAGQYGAGAPRPWGQYQA